MSARIRLILVYKGGAGSGHWGHAGRPGKVGGSVSGDVAMSVRTGPIANISRRLRKMGYSADEISMLHQAGSLRNVITAEKKFNDTGWDEEVFIPYSKQQDRNIAEVIIRTGGTAKGMPGISDEMYQDAYDRLYPKKQKVQSANNLADTAFLDKHNIPQGYRMEVRELANAAALQPSVDGGGYFINHQSQKLYDLTDEFSGGTNDHPGAMVAISAPSLFGVTNTNAARLHKENIKDEFGDSWSSAYDRVWGNLQVGNTRVRVFGDSLSLQTPTMNNSVLGTLQQWHKDGKLPASAANDDVYWESWDGSGWMHTTYSKLLSANSLSDFVPDKELALIQ